MAVEPIERSIYVVRGQRVMLDADLARFYGVTTKRLNQQVTRNIDRFPEDFSFQLTSQEYEALRLQIATSKVGRGGRRYLPRVFTEHGALMAANVINSPVAVKASVQVVRAFVRLRQVLAQHVELAHKLAELESHVTEHDEQIRALFAAIRQLMSPPEPPPRKIGFRVRESKGSIECGRAKLPQSPPAVCPAMASPHWASKQN